MKFALTTEDKHSGTWRRIKAHLEEERRIAREMNDKSQPEERTASLRGRIALLNELLKLDGETKAPD